MLELFGITLDAFRVVGSLILLPIGLRLIEGREVGLPDVNKDLGILGVVSIGLPLLAGPAAISLIVADAPASWRGRLAQSLVISLLAASTYLVLLVSMPLRRALGELQEKVMKPPDGSAAKRDRCSDNGERLVGVLPDPENLVMTRGAKS